MKTCPYCAEEIKDAAIVCRYCGRDLPKDGETISTTTKLPSDIPQKQLTSAWAQGAKVSLILTILASVAIFIQYQNAPAELLGNILFGIPVTFVIWWLLVTGLIALWRKGIGAFFGVLLGLGILIVVYLILSGTPLNSTNISSYLRPPTPTITPSATLNPSQSLRATTIAQPTAHPWPSPFTTMSIAMIPDGCFPWYEVNKSFEGRIICVTGIVVVYLSGVSAYQCKTYFTHTPHTFYLVNCFPTRLKAGDCISATGIVGLGNYETPYIQWDSYSYCNQ